MTLVEGAIQGGASQASLGHALRPGELDLSHRVILYLEDITVSFDGFRALDALTLSIDAGELRCVIGPNGAGKTTLVDALTGSVRPAQGRVVFDGVDVTGRAAYRLARAGIARTFQSVELFGDLNVRENLLVAAETPSVFGALAGVFKPAGVLPDAVEWAIEVTRIGDIAERYPDEISHGQRKVVGVARALATRPKLLLLDEPAAGLDTDETRELGERLRGLTGHGVTQLLIDHDMGLVLEVCDRVAVIDFGKLIAFGPPGEIRANPRVVEAYLGTAA
jgi:branched-chain amino acid transport system ATP-binding protein